MKYAKPYIILSLILVMVLSGCGNKTGNVILPSVEEITENVTENESETETVRETVKTGIEVMEKGQILNSNGDVSQIGKISFDAKIDDRYFVFQDISEINNKIIMSYGLVTRDDNYENNPEIYDYSKDKCEMHLAELDDINLKITEDVIVDGDFSYTSHTANGVWCMSYDNDGVTGKFYDSSFENKYKTSFNGTRTGFGSLDNEFYYYEDSGRLFRYSYNDEKVSEIDFGITAYCSELQMVYTDGRGVDYLFVSCLCGDLKNYNGVFDTEQGQFIYLKNAFENEPPVSYIMNNTYIAGFTDTVTGQYWNVFTDGVKPVTYAWPDQNYYISVIIMSNGDAFFYRTIDNTVEFAVFDKDTNLCKADSSVTLDRGVNEYGMINPQINPIYMDNGDVFMVFSDGYNAYYFFEWDMKKNSEYWDSMSAMEYPVNIPDVALIDEMYDPNTFFPGEVSEELQPLLARRKEIEDKHGIVISIGKECSSMNGGYAVCALEDYETVKQSLDILDEELSKYPDNFLEQIKYNGYDTIHFYIASTLIGMGYGLDYAGGFQNEVGNEMLITIDCTVPDDARTTVHHELSHIIDDFIDAKAGFDENEWKSFNVVTEAYADLYTYDYGLFGYDGMEKYIFDFSYDDNSESCFVDCYSMTFPTEDRARIWESVMMMEEASVDFEQSPILTEKLNYYAQCVRQVFDTTGWENVIWERYL